MKQSMIWSAAALLLGCAAPQKRIVGIETASSAQHISAAQEHDEEASRLERASDSPDAPRDPKEPPLVCLDQPLAELATTLGAEPIRLMRPCWSVPKSQSELYRREAEKHRKEAEQHRAKAGALVRAERDACRDIGVAELSQTPFYHRADIIRVEPHYEKGKLRGAHVLFRKVPGLTKVWMQKSTQCHLARAAVMGHTATFMSYCPLMLVGVSVAVEETSEGISVTVRAGRGEIAAAVLGRTRDLLKPALRLGTRGTAGVPARVHNHPPQRR